MALAVFRLAFEGIALWLPGQPAFARDIGGGVHRVDARHGAVGGTGFKHFVVFECFLCFHRIVNKNNVLYLLF